MTAIEQAWCILKNEYEEGGCNCPEAQLLKKLYYAGMIVGSGNAGGPHGVLGSGTPGNPFGSHPDEETLSEELQQLLGWPEEGHPAQYQGDE